MSYTYDANGNQSGYNYDVENRISSILQGESYLYYCYDAQNRRIFSWPSTLDSMNNQNVYTVYYYTPAGQKLGAYQFNIVQNSTPTLYVTLMTSDRYFGAKRLAPQDRLGSAGDFYPWGEAKGSNNPQDTWSYATYWRDSASGLDYANNRYYSNAYGRFMTPDPYITSGGPGDPQSWNRYSYTRGDPVNRFDPTGTDDCASDFGDASQPYDPSSSCSGSGYSCMVFAMDFEQDPDAATFYAQAQAMGCAQAAAAEVAQAGGGGGGGQPSPLQCFFSGATFPTPGWGYVQGPNTNPNSLGYFVPANLTFTAIGGNGTYTWSDQQITIHGGTVTYSNGQTVNMSIFPATHESLGTTGTPGSSATFFDSPGIPACSAQLGCIVSANITWTLILSAQVSSGGQTVNCPTVVWQVQETWTGIMIGNDTIQWAFGGGMVLSP